MTEDGATYDLNELKRLINNPRTRRIRRSALVDAVSLGYSSDVEMVHQIMKLKPSNFYKTMPADKCPGLWQDVYRSFDGENELYIKIQKGNNGEGVIISFKER